MTEKWVGFYKGPIQSYDMDVKSITQDVENTRINIVALFDDSVTPITIIFEDVLPLISSYEKDKKLKKFELLKQEYGDEFYRNNIIFEIKNSKLIEDLIKDRDEFYLDNVELLKHFVVITDESYIDIVSFSEPNILMQ